MKEVVLLIERVKIEINDVENHLAHVHVVSWKEK